MSDDKSLIGPSHSRCTAWALLSLLVMYPR